MSNGSSATDASSAALGYLYQCRYALLLALQKGDEQNLCLSIEKLDDIAFHESPDTPLVARECLQLKHTINRAGRLGDSSADVWKTLKNWIDAVKNSKIDLDRVSLFLVTTTTASDRNAVQHLRPPAGDSGTSKRRPQEALRQLEEAGAKSTNAVVKMGYSALKTLTPGERKQLFQRIYLLDSAPTVLDLNQAFISVLLYAAPAEHRDAFVQRLEGWWWARIVRHLSDQSPGTISVAEIHLQIDDLREQFRRESLPDDMSSATVPPEAASSDDERPFVRQLQLIRLTATRLRNAQEDHYRAFTQRSRWLKDKLLALDETEKYELRLIDGWRERFEIIVEAATQECDEAILAQHGGSLYNWISTEAAGRSDLWVRTDFKCGYMTRGSYHMLADQLRVGWHPQFAALLSSQPSAAP